MNKIITLKEAIRVSRKLKNGGKTIVLAGGCFDVLHPGHLAYLEQAKKQGDILFVFLESDRNVRRLKGEGRPVNTQRQRAKTLSQIYVIDYVLLLPPLDNDSKYFVITKQLMPDVIAITAGDPKQAEKEKQAKSVGGRVALVTPLLKNYSTTKILKNLP